MRPALTATLAGLLPVAAAVRLLDLPETTISAAHENMRAHASDANSQLQSCEELGALADKHREGPGPFGGHKVATELLNGGIGEALATGLANAVALDVAKGATSPGPAASTCARVIFSLTVQNDYDKGQRLIQTSPSLWSALVSFYRSFKRDRGVLGQIVMLAGLYGTPQPRAAVCGLVKAGGLDLVLELLDQHSIVSDPPLFQGLLAALSDNVQADRCAAEAIANYGGPLEGIKLMVKAMRWSRESNVSFREGNGFGLLYEIVHDTMGILRHDDDANHTFAKAFVKAGYLGQLVPIMKLQPEDEMLQQNGCDAMALVLRGDSTARERLVGLGAVVHLEVELRRMSKAQLSHFCTVYKPCATVLEELGGELEHLVQGVSYTCNQ